MLWSSKFTHLHWTQLNIFFPQYWYILPFVFGLVRNCLKYFTNSWFVTLPPFFSIKSRISAKDNSFGTAIFTQFNIFTFVQMTKSVTTWSTNFTPFYRECQLVPHFLVQRNTDRLSQTLIHSTQYTLHICNTQNILNEYYYTMY